MLVYGELQTFTRILIDNLIYDLGIMAIVYKIWNRVGPPCLELSTVAILLLLVEPLHCNETRCSKKSIQNLINNDLFTLQRNA